jgi:hypothetical protein
MDYVPTLGLLKTVAVLGIDVAFTGAYSEGRLQISVFRSFYVSPCFMWNLKMGHISQF